MVCSAYAQKPAHADYWRSAGNEKPSVSTLRAFLTIRYRQTARPAYLDSSKNANRDIYCGEDQTDNHRVLGELAFSVLLDRL